MGSEEEHVRVSGIRWALFCFDALNEPCGSEGFLFGTKTLRQTQVVTDHAVDHVKRETIFQVNAVVPTGVSYSFYDQNFDPDFRRIEELQAKHRKEGAIIGWFKFRRGGKHGRKSLMESVSDKLRFSWLAEGEPPALLLYLTHRECHIRSPLSYQFELLTDLGFWKGIRLRVINMGDTSDEDKYWPKSVTDPCASAWVSSSVSAALVAGAKEGTRNCLSTLQASADNLLRVERERNLVQAELVLARMEERGLYSLKRKWWEIPVEEEEAMNEYELKPSRNPASLPNTSTSHESGDSQENTSTDDPRKEVGKFGSGVKVENESEDMQWAKTSKGPTNDTRDARCNARGEEQMEKVPVKVEEWGEISQ